MFPVRFIQHTPLEVFARDAFFEPLQRAEALLNASCRSSIRIDVREEEGRYVVYADLPGFAKDELDITVEDGILTVAAQKSAETDEPQGHYHLRERRAGNVARSLRLPEDARADAINATLKEGILTLTIEKAESAKPHKIEVKQS